MLKSVGLDAAPRGIEIEMLLVGGKHRTIAEFTVLAAQAGLKVAGTDRQASGHAVVECRL